MSVFRIYLDSGNIVIKPEGALPSGYAAASAKPAAQIFPVDDYLTCTRVGVTDNVNITTDEGKYVFYEVDAGNFRLGKASNSTYSVTALVSTLNGSSYFGATTLESQLTTEKARILSLENTVKTASGDRGVFITDAKDETASKVKLTTTSAKLQAGGKTGIEADESSPGTLTFTVASGASGSEVETTGMTLSGDTTGKTKLDVIASEFNLKMNSSTAAGKISFYEGSANGTNRLTLTAPASLTADTTLTFPDGAGSSGQVLSTNGAGVLSWVDQSSGGSVAIHGGASDILRVQSDQIGVSTNLTSTIAADRLVFYDHSATKLTALELGTNLSISGTTLNATDTNTNLGNTDLTLSGARVIELSGNDLDIQTGSTSKLLYDVSANQGQGEWLFGSRARFLQPVEFHASGGTSQSQIRFREPPMGGSSSVILKGPSTNLTSDVTFVLPDADGTSGQFITTDGSGNLSFASASGGSSGPAVLANISGRWTWSNTDSGERVLVGSTSYGPFNWYNFTTEPNTTSFRTYSASDAVGTATETFDAWRVLGSSLQMPTTDKKVKVTYYFRIQNAPANSTWGFSLWGADKLTSGNSGSQTLTLRGLSSDVTQPSNSSSRVHHGSFTTTAVVDEDVLVFCAEHRTGTLTTTTYMLGQWMFELVD